MTCSLVFYGQCGSLRCAGPAWRLIIDYPFDSEGHTPTEDLDRLLDGAAVHLVNTDPPYNVRVEPRSNNAIAAGLSSFPGRSSVTPEWMRNLGR